jgi:hypothetical protein
VGEGGISQVQITLQLSVPSSGQTVLDGYTDAALARGVSCGRGLGMEKRADLIKDMTKACSCGAMFEPTHGTVALFGDPLVFGPKSSNFSKPLIQKGSIANFHESSIWVDLASGRIRMPERRTVRPQRGSLPRP